MEDQIEPLEEANRHIEEITDTVLDNIEILKKANKKTDELVDFLNTVETPEIRKSIIVNIMQRILTETNLTPVEIIGILEHVKLDTYAKIRVVTDLMGAMAYNRVVTALENK